MGIKILSKPDNWVIHPKNFWHDGADGRSKTYRIFDILIQSGYMKKTTIRVGGKVDALYDFSEYPKFNSLDSIEKPPAKERNKGRFSKPLIPDPGTGLVPDPGIRDGQSLVPGSGTLLTNEREKKTNKVQVTTKEEKKENQGAPVPAPFKEINTSRISGKPDNDDRVKSRDQLRTATQFYGYSFDDSTLDLALDFCLDNGIKDPSSYCLNQKLQESDSLVYHYYQDRVTSALILKGIQNYKTEAGIFMVKGLSQKDPIGYFRTSYSIKAFVDGVEEEVEEEIEAW